MKTAPLRAAILALDGCYASSLAGFGDVLHVTNAHLSRQQHKTGTTMARSFAWQFVSHKGRPVTACNGLALNTAVPLPEEKLDIIFIPGLYYSGHDGFERMLEAAEPQREWLKAQWREGAALAANCTGTFLLAETGLLHGRQATTTWWLERLFRERYPGVNLQLRSMVTEEDRLWCAGASASYLLQAVRMVEHFCGANTAMLTAKTMLIDTSQTTQLPYLPLQMETVHSDTMVAKAQHWLLKHFAEDVSLPELAAALSVSVRTLIRHFNSVLGTTPLTYLQNLRIEISMTLLESGDLSIEEIANQVGYQNASSFTRLFRKQVGSTPAAYRSRFTSMATV
ncbi:GlxA family transcriptional regulator [Pseudomonas fluorescens]|jgi:transcriptional regulator GlxA family with amidase domain|uniref:GlxA family transcriptional regulator n=1 Tax=Pseudomonas fluorescens TaxID=294 RepID=UPI003F9790F2